MGLNRSNTETKYMNNLTGNFLELRIKGGNNLHLQSTWNKSSSFGIIFIIQKYAPYYNFGKSQKIFLHNSRRVLLCWSGFPFYSKGFLFSCHIYCSLFSHCHLFSVPVSTIFSFWPLLHCTTSFLLLAYNTEPQELLFLLDIYWNGINKT